jgi:predicted transcriptional regulator
MITGKLIKKMRKECGLTQQQLAEVVGITQAHVAKIENERVNPRLATINKIISVLKTNKTLKCESFITKRIISAKPNDSVYHIVKLMRENDISQIPVMEGERCVGSISEKTIVRNLDKISSSTKVKDLMDESFPVVSCRENVDLVKALLEYHQAVLVSEKGRIIGIVTKSDLLNLLK